VVHLSNGKHMPLDKEYIGKYFLVPYCLSLDTNKVLPGIGYVVPSDMWSGNILVGIEKGNGAMHIKNYIIGTKFDVKPESTFGNLILKDGKYCIKANNSVCQKINIAQVLYLFYLIFKPLSAII
jgi:hypothetical protein